MAEEESELELDRFKKELESLLNDDCGLQSKSYCARFCELVEEYTCRWQVPLPQLQVLRSALCAFVPGTASFPSDCEHVRYTLSSLALSVFELLLFFGKDEFPEDPLKDIMDSFQECQSSLVRYQNVYLLQVRHIIKDGGPWASPVLEGILKEVKQQQEEVDRYLSSEVPMFFELRVRYLLACERTREAMALALKCSQHPVAGRELFFKQAYLCCLWKLSQKERLLTEMAEIDVKVAVKILCIAENEEKDELLLELSRGFLLQQLRSGDMYYLWDLIFIWCKLYLRVKTREHFLQECKILLLSAANIKAIFPFIKIVLTEHLGKEGLTFCIELCAEALQTDLKDDPVTKSLLYKTIAYLLPNDLEVCRACALLVFFLERTVDSYKTVFYLYNHPDLEYHLDASPIGNNVRFEMIQILKRGLFFDPEFWSLLNIKTNCLKLMSDEVARVAVCEITDEHKWSPNYCVREHCKCRTEPERTIIRKEAKPGSRDKQESGTAKKLVMSPSGDTSSETPQHKKRGRKPGSRLTKNLELFPVRRSFRQLDLAQNHARQLSNKCQKFLTRQSEKNILKRRGRKPRWLLEQLAALGENTAPGQHKKPGRKPKLFSSLKDILVEMPVIKITTEYSYPDNEVELPDDVDERRKTTFSTDHRFSQTQTIPCSKTLKSFLQVLLEKSSYSLGDQEDFRPQDVIIAIEKFHTYAKVPEEEKSPLPDHFTDHTVLTAALAEKQEDNFQFLTAVKNPSEPIEGTQLTSLTAAVTQEIPGVNDRLDIPLLLPAEHIVIPESKVSTMINPSKDQTASIVTNTNHAPENTQISSGLANSPNNATDYICDASKKAMDIISTSENPPNTTIQRKGFSPKETSDTGKNPPDVKAVVDASATMDEFIIETPVALEEAVKSQIPTSQPSTEAEETPLSDILTPICAPVQTKLQCKLCNKKYETPLSHALWHYRTEKKCMFCDKLAMTRGALQHFQKHIKELGNVEVPLETKKCMEDIPAMTESHDQNFHSDQTTPESPPKKAKPGFAQIKSRLLMRLKLTRKAQTHHETEKSSDNETSVKKQTSTPEQKESIKDDNQSVPQETIRYLTRGSIKMSEHKGRLRRTRLGRQAMATRALGGGATKDASVHRMNGVIRRKRKMRCLMEESNPTTGKGETKVDTEKMKHMIRRHKDVYEIRAKTDKTPSTNNCAKTKLPEEPRAKKKKLNEDEEKVDVKLAKKLKNGDDTSDAKLMNTVEEKNSVPYVEKQQNGTETSETSNMVRKKKVGSTPVVSCPIVACTFQAMPGPVLSHVLIHHPGDTKALEFFYNLAVKKCLFCTRRIWTPQHFFDHVVSHRGNLKHPCYHVTCQKRFKTRMDVSDHMEKDHNLLKAVCCFPGCMVESASLKDLYRHEKSHYKVVLLNKNRLVNSRKATDKLSLKVSREKNNPAPAAQQTEEGLATETETPLSSFPPSPPDEITAQNPALPVKLEDEKPLMLNKSSVHYSGKRLVNGHIDHTQKSGLKAPPAASKEPEQKSEKVAVKPFSRLPPSAYLDELYLSMPKKWRGPQASTKGVTTDAVSPVKRQNCSRCNAAFDCEEELQLHREKCTSLFGFDSDDENAF